MTFSLKFSQKTILRQEVSCKHAFSSRYYTIEPIMEDLDKQLVFYVNVLGMTVFLLIIFYFYITAKPKDAVD